MNADVSKEMATPLDVPESPECAKLLSFGVLAGYVVAEPSFPFPAEAAKVSRISLLMVSQGCGQFVIGSGHEFFSDIAECAEIVAPEKRLSFETFKDFQHDKESPVKVIDRFVKPTFAAIVKATALGLRQRNGAFNVFISHCASNPGARVRTRQVLVTSGASG
jgi:hypothetical protein